ncbi:PKD domain-containing protein [Pseudoalteromonas rubra]|nr:S8 family serine peptidase [Pseudoalteromonas rubra]
MPKTIQGMVTSSLPIKNMFYAMVSSAFLVGCGGGSDNSSSDKGELQQRNAVPTANAGEEQTVEEQTDVTLSGSGTDPDGSVARFSWAQTAGTIVTIANADSATAGFTAPEVSADETLTFQLTVTDNGGATTTDSVDIVVQNVNQLPTANAGEDQTVEEQTDVTLAGSGTDPDGTITSFSWAQTAGTAVTIANTDSATASFTAPNIATPEVAEFELTVTDNDGAIYSDTVSITIQPTFAQISSLPLMYSDTPVHNRATTVSLITSENEDVGEVEWQVVSQPNSSNLVLSASNDKKSVTFTASEPGDYKVVVRSASNGSEKATSFSVSPVFSFDNSKIEGNDGSVNLGELVGVIKNQAWVHSAHLTEAELRNIVLNYASLTVIGYDPVEGLLIEFDETDLSSKEVIEELKLESGVSSVALRDYVGENVDKNFFTPNDGDSFNDLGSNWHLENATYGAKLVNAWDYTRGSSEIIVGITDSGYYSNHEDLSKRFSTLLTSGNDDHGTGVAGIIGASTDNSVGISGINHVSLMRAAKNNKSSYVSLLREEKVKVVNNSWGDMGHDSGSTIKGIVHTRKYRKIAEKNENVLHVWAAGNDGANAKTQNGALHLNSFGGLSKLDNVIVVAAVGVDGKLVHYSNYGNTIDLAAPTELKSSRRVTSDGTSDYYEGNSYGTEGSGGFDGTSAAAPVVTGVASLVYSLYPGFTGKEVKDILINSATEAVSKRYIASGDEGENNSNIETLTHPIPVLNAEKALEKAQEIIDSKVTVTDSIPDPFTAQAQIVFSSVDENLDVVSVEWELQSSNDGGTTWHYVNGMSVDGNTVTPFLDTSTPYQRIVAMVTLRNPDSNDETTASKEYEFSYSTVGMSALDTVSLAPLPAVEVGIELLTGLPITSTGLTNDNGNLVAYMKPGIYRARGSFTDYQDVVTTFTINELQSQQVNLNMTRDSIGAVGSLSGQVIDVDGKPIARASIRISGGEQTNGFFATATTDASGHYVISNISKTDSDGNAIPAFIMETSGFGYTTVVKEDVIVLSGKGRVENFTLAPVDLSDNTVFFDDFEQGVGGWTATGFWNQINLNNNTIANTFVDGGYSILAPDEAGPKALLPAAFNGDFVWWYGQPDTGSFIGTQLNLDHLLSGGTSTSSNSGQLTSPSINLVSITSPYLRFRTWWEIESVNPNENGFDIMEIQISTDGGSSFETIKKLNPFVDPNDADWNRDPRPFSSGGYNRKPVWALEEVDLSDYAGDVIIIRFDFKTRDHLFNGFRGWIVDTLEVVERSPSESIATAANKPQSALAAKYLPANVLKGYKVNASDSFGEIHKKPKAYLNEGTPARK